MGKHNMQYQIFQAIDRAYSPGFRRHSAVDYHGDRVASFADKNGLKDTGKDFAKWCKSVGVKWLVDVRPEHVTAYLDGKAATCSTATLKAYRSRLDKIGKLASNYVGRDISSNYHGEMPQRQTASKYDSKVRTMAMTRADYDKAVSTMRQSDSKVALGICAAFGLRADEVAHLRSRDIGTDSLTVEQGKGGRDRTIKAETAEQKQELHRLQTLATGKRGDEHLLHVRSGSINKTLSRAMERVGIDKYKEHKTGVHAVRKMYATERYNSLRAQGYNHREAWGHVSETLGHGQDREDLFRVYVKN